MPRSHPSLLVNEELARAIRNESAAAVKHWWGVSVGVVARWRKACGVGRVEPEGSRRLVRAAAEKGGAQLRGKALPPEQVERRRQTALEKNLGAYLQPGYHGPRWTAEDLALLGTESDEAIAARSGRSVNVVRLMRTRRERQG